MVGGYYGIAVYTDNLTLWITDCDISGFLNAGIYSQYAMLYALHNVIHDNASNNYSAAFNVAGSWSDHMPRGVIAHNLIYGIAGHTNKAGGIDIAGGSWDIHNNTLYDLSGAAGTWGIRINDATGAACSIWDNIIQGASADQIDNGIERVAGGGSIIYEDYNNFYNVTTPAVNFTAGDNNLAVDSGFVDAANGDFDITNEALFWASKPDVGGEQLHLGALAPAANHAAVGDVQSGVAYGPGDLYAGTFGVPAENVVKSGEQFGAGGTEYTGSYSEAPIATSDLSADSVNAHLTAFGKSVTYNKADGSSRTITAVIDFEANPTAFGGKGKGPKILLLCRNDSTTGIDAGEITYGVDTVTIAEPDGISRDRVIRAALTTDDDATEVVLR